MLKVFPLGVSPRLSVKGTSTYCPEVSCHPGHLESRDDAQYNREREVELRSLCDAQVRAAIAEEGIRLISFREYARIAARPRPSCRGAS